MIDVMVSSMDVPGAMRRSLALQAFAFVAALVSLNALFNLFARLAGWDYPYTTFLSNPIDNFGDFFSLLRSYPHGERSVLHDAIGLHAMVPLDPPSAHMPFPDPRLPQVTHFHMMPLATIASLGAIALMQEIDAVTLFLTLNGALMIYTVAILRRWSVSWTETAAWFGLWIIAYPTLFGFVRGNLFAEITVLLLVDSLLRGLKRETPLMSAVLFSVAVNIRPNAILFGLPLLICYWGTRWRFVATVATVGLITFVTSIAVAHQFYPQYGLRSFLAGLKAYYRIYAVGFFGMAHGSSMLGALKVISSGKYVLWQDRAATVVALAIAIAASWLRVARRIDDTVMLFLICAACCLGTAVYGDYHLGIFMIVPLALSASGLSDDPRVAMQQRICWAAAILMLAPKNYLFLAEISLQIVWNPVILLGAASVLIVSAVSGNAAAQWRFSRPRAA